MTNLICIVCPKGCHLKVDEENGFAVTGNACARGAEYGRTELINPTRVITSTVRVQGALHRRCPVKTDKPLPKGLIAKAMQSLTDVTLQAPVSLGQVVVEDICGSGVRFISSRAMEAL